MLKVRIFSSSHIIRQLLFQIGSTVKPLVNLLEIQKSEESEDTSKGTIGNDVHSKNMDHVMSGINSIVGRKVSSNAFWNTIQIFERDYLRNYLIVDNGQHKWDMKVQEISMDEHYARLYGPAMLIKQNQLHDMLDVLEEMDNEEEEEGTKLLHNILIFFFSIFFFFC